MRRALHIPALVLAVSLSQIGEFSFILGQEELFLKLAGDLPKEMVFQRELLISRL